MAWKKHSKLVQVHALLVARIQDTFGVIDFEKKKKTNTEKTFDKKKKKERTKEVLDLLILGELLWD